jgi:tripartite-type tricarboxylate transporter receptor subunit TctC
MRLALPRRVLLASAFAAPALAQQRFPDRPIRLIVPFTAGGTTDVQMRALADAAGRRFGQPVVVENKLGAGGTLGAQAMLHEKPDGYALSTMPITTIRYPLMQQRPAWNPLTDFTWIIQCTGYLFGVVVRADAPWQDFDQFMAYAKTNPGKVNYGTPGVGGSLHLTMQQIAQERDIEWVQVPFRGVAENIQALLGGQIHATADSSGWAELVESGQLRLLCTWGAERAKRFPQVKTLREYGFDIVSVSPYGIAGPRGLDPAIARILHDVFKDALQDPQHLAVLERMDMQVMYAGLGDYAAEVARTMEAEAPLVRRLGIRL